MCAPLIYEEYFYDLDVFIAFLLAAWQFADQSDLIPDLADFRLDTGQKDC